MGARPERGELSWFPAIREEHADRNSWHRVWCGGSCGFCVHQCDPAQRHCRFALIALRRISLICTRAHPNPRSEPGSDLAVSPVAGAVAEWRLVAGMESFASSTVELLLPVPTLHNLMSQADTQGGEWGQHTNSLLANVVHVVGTKSRAAVTSRGRIVAWRNNDSSEPVSVLPRLPRRSLPRPERTSWIEWYPSKGKCDHAEDRTLKLVCGRCFVVAMRDNGEIWLATRQNKHEWGWHSVSLTSLWRETNSRSLASPTLPRSSSQPRTTVSRSTAPGPMRPHRRLRQLHTS